MAGNAAACCLSLKLPFFMEMRTEFPGEHVNKTKARIVPGTNIVRTWVAEPDDETDGQILLSHLFTLRNISGAVRDGGCHRQSVNNAQNGRHDQSAYVRDDHSDRFVLRAQNDRNGHDHCALLAAHLGRASL